jgi:hypothetical protein
MDFKEIDCEDEIIAEVSAPVTGVLQLDEAQTAVRHKVQCMKEKTDNSRCQEQNPNHVPPECKSDVSQSSRYGCRNLNI